MGLRPGSDPLFSRQPPTFRRGEGLPMAASGHHQPRLQRAPSHDSVMVMTVTVDNSGLKIATTFEVFFMIVKNTSRSDHRIHD